MLPETKTAQRQRRMGVRAYGRMSEKGSSPSPTPPRPHTHTLIHLLLLCAITVLVVGRDVAFGDFWWSDAARHAMDGVFIYDFVRDAHKGLDYKTYAERYYAQYPALGFAFYPPFFALVEALFFSVFGISAWVARLTVLAFAVLAVLLWYQWIQRLAGPVVALVSAVLLITSPTIVRWAREVMLEMPALALIIAACFFADKFVRSTTSDSPLIRERKRRWCLYLSVLMAGLAAWTKQTALFIVPVLAVYLTLTETPRFWLTRPAWIAALWGAVLLVPLCGYILYFGGVALGISVGDVDFGIPRFSWRSFTFYLSELPRALSAPVCALACVGLVTLKMRNAECRMQDEPLRTPHSAPCNSSWTLPLLWTLGYYLFAWYVSIKQDRYIYFWLPPFALFAAWGATWFVEQFDRLRYIPRPVAYVLLALFCGYRVGAASTMSTPYVAGYEPAAAYVAEHPKGHVVLFDGYYAGCFIFHLRRHDPRKRLIVLRGDKMFNPIKAMKVVGQVTLVNSPSDIRRLLHDYGVNQIVVEDGPPLSPASRMLRAMVRTEDFSLVNRWRLESKDGHKVGTWLRLYERRRVINPQRTRLHILIPAFDRVIKVPLQPLSGESTGQ